jgi:hypothetical protein
MRREEAARMMKLDAIKGLTAMKCIGGYKEAAYGILTILPFM